MSNTIEMKIGSFLIRDDEENGMCVYVYNDGELYFCDNFSSNQCPLADAKEFIKRNSKGKIKIVDGEFISK